MKGLDLRIDGVNLGYVIQIISSAILGGKALRVQITEWKDKRSLNQNRLYWMWLNEICDQIQKRIGQEHDTETLHEYFKQSYCPQKSKLLGTKEIVIASTAKLDKGEMHFYLNQIEQWCIERGFRLTIPDGCEYSNLREVQNG